MKKKIFFIFIFIIFILFFICINNCKAVDIPQSVHNYANSINHGFNNYVILYDENDGNFYVPIEMEIYDSSKWENGNWRYVLYNDTECLVSPDWWLLDLIKIGSSNTLVSSNNIDSNSVIQFNPSFDNHNFKIVYSSKPIHYLEFPGFSDGEIYFNNLSDFSVTISKQDEINNTLTFSTNWFNYEYFGRFSCYYSDNNENWFKMSTKTLNTDRYVFYGFDFTTMYNGVYYFKCVDNETGEYKIVTYNVTNLIDKINIEFYLSNYNNTNEPIYILSNKYYYEGEYNATDDFLNNYDIDIAYGYDTPYSFAPFSIEGYDEEQQKYYRQYQYKIVQNGIYNLRITNLINGEISYLSFTINNIGFKNPYGEDVYYNNYNEDGEFDPKPILFLEYINTTTIRIRTQPFIFNEIISLECYFSSDGENYEKISNIYQNTIDTSNSIYDYNTGNRENLLNTYYFYYDVSIDGTYYFKFYNIELDKYVVSSIDVNIKEFINSNINNINNFTDKMVVWARKHFGFLLYPFEFVIDFLTRVLNINYTEPILYIPELREPFYNNKILDATSFNFNSILTNNTISFIYNIYLVAVDVILIFLFIVFCKHIFEEVFGK